MSEENDEEEEHKNKPRSLVFDLLDLHNNQNHTVNNTLSSMFMLRIMYPYLFTNRENIHPIFDISNYIIGTTDTKFNHEQGIVEVEQEEKEEQPEEEQPEEEQPEEEQPEEEQPEEEKIFKINNANILNSIETISLSNKEINEPLKSDNNIEQAIDELTEVSLEPELGKHIIEEYIKDSEEEWILVEKKL